MSWWTPKQDPMIIITLAKLEKTITQLRIQLNEIQEKEQKRYDNLLQNMLHLSWRQPQPLPAPPQPMPAILKELGMFEEVPLGDESGYTMAELALGGEYDEGGGG